MNNPSYATIKALKRNRKERHEEMQNLFGGDRS